MGTRLGLLPIVLALLVLAWNVTLAGWIARRSEAGRLFSTLTGLAGLLVAPAAVLSIAASTDAGARTITGVAWLWPVTCVLLVLQAATATGRRLVSSSVGVPIMCYNIVIALIAIGDDLVVRTGEAPWLLQGVIASRDAVLGIVMGRSALASPLAIMVPLLTPAYPARWRFSALIRAVLVLYAAAALTLLIMEWPRGIGAVRSYEAATLSLSPRDPSSFTLGVSFLPEVTGLPSARAVRAGAGLYDRVSPASVLVVLRARAVRTSGLDSLVRVLAPYRGDSVRVFVALSFDRDDAIAARDDPVGTARLRLDALERVVERVRPQAIIPALPPLLPSARFAPPVSRTWMQTHLTSAAAMVQRARPATAVVWIATEFGESDSLMYAWAASAASPVDVVGFAATPGFSGLRSLDARLRAAERWVESSSAGGRAHWLLTAGLPRAHGELAQADAIQHVLAWGSRRRYIRGVIVGELLDEATTLGLFAADGRERPAVDMLRRAVPRALPVR